MWRSRTKNDLIIEVWEKLDCENVGSAEIEAIETVVAAEYGDDAVDSPMVIARLLADEGAELRHDEIMRLYVTRAEDRPYDAAFRNILRFDDLRSALATVRDLENLRQAYRSAGDNTGLRLVRETAVKAKRSLNETDVGIDPDGLKRRIRIEIAQWLTVWLQTPEIFDDWVEMRQHSADFIERFGKVKPE